ncbi:MAG: thioredoxin family protein [Bryobacterales bacterium]|nr:thioredoxin family protein [Bryobacteraceae bacterium]MDW8130461.1 thioredoxin family protein [Bryobacterales bacterium]
MRFIGLAGLASLAAALVCAQEFKLGGRVGDFELKDTAGKTVTLAQLKGNVTAIFFIATRCPISNDYNERMKALYKEYSPRGVKFVFINPNSTEPAAEVAEHAQKWGFPFPVYKDDNNVVADRFGAQFTPEVFVLDRDGVIRYHGAIDDSRPADKVTKQYLRNALDELLAGKAVTVAETKAFGCTIKRVKKAS